MSHPYSLPIGGCDQIVIFADKESLARAVGTLISCHDHNFVVMGNWTGAGRSKLALACSQIATQCLMEHLGPTTLGFTATSTPRVPY